MSLEDFTYHCDAEFESGQFGKCVMYLSPDNEVRFAIGKINPVLLARVDTSPELARNFFQRDMQDVVELHRYTYRDIPSERVHRKLGGGAYLVRSDETVVVDFESGDFGKMHLGLATRCLETKGLTIEIVDDKYWDKRTPVEYLEAKMKRS